MAYSVLLEDIDEFDPDHFYNLVAEQVNLRKLPGVSFDWSWEYRGTKFLGGALESIRCLKVKLASEIYDAVDAQVMAYPFGRTVFIAVHTDWHSDNAVAERRVRRYIQYLETSRLTIMTAIAERATREAVQRFQESRGKELPEALPEEVFSPEDEDDEEWDEEDDHS